MSNPETDYPHNYSRKHMVLLLGLLPLKQCKYDLYLVSYLAFVAETSVALVDRNMYMHGALITSHAWMVLLTYIN